MQTQRRLTEYVGTGLRLVLGAHFIHMGLVKALDPVTFLKLTRQYDLVQTPWLLNSVAAALPWFEVLCGILLVLGIAVRGTALTLIAMLVPFTTLVLKRALEIASIKKLAFCAVKFDCGCGSGEVFICRKLAENALLLGIAVFLLWGAGRFLSFNFSPFAPRIPKSE